ncbi:MAG: hypothetical protein SGPRY_014353, partial [Prymnesium sp.]
VDRVLESCTQHLTIDVQGVFRKADIELPELHIRKLVQSLVSNCDDAQQRRQRLFLHDLVSRVLLPFFTECSTFVEIETLNCSNLGLKLAPKLPWLKAFKFHVESKVLPREVLEPTSPMRIYKLLKKKVKACSSGNVEWRFDHCEEFEEYVTPRSHSLAHHLKAKRPERLPSKLRPLLIPEVSDPATIQSLVDMLSSHKKEHLFVPLSELQDFLLSHVTNIVTTADNSDASLSDGIKDKLMHVIRQTLKKQVHEMVDELSLRYDKLCSNIPQELDDIISSEMRNGGPGRWSFSRIAERYDRNQPRRKRLARDAPKLAAAVAASTHHLLAKSVEPFLDDSFVSSFTQVLNAVYTSLEDCIENRDSTVIKDLDVVVVNKRYMRICAGWIKAFHQTNLAQASFKDYPDFQNILDFASMPLDLIPQKGKNFPCQPLISRHVPSETRLIDATLHGLHPSGNPLSAADHLTSALTVPFVTT